MNLLCRYLRVFVLICFRLMKGRVMFFYCRQLFGFFFHLMVLICEVFLNNFLKQQFVVLLFWMNEDFVTVILIVHDCHQNLVGCKVNEFVIVGRDKNFTAWALKNSFSLAFNGMANLRASTPLKHFTTKWKIVYAFSLSLCLFVHALTLVNILHMS